MATGYVSDDDAASPIHSLGSTNRVRSLIWLYGKIDPSNNGIFLCSAGGSCNNFPISRGGKNPKKYTTANVMRHLERVHPIELQKGKERLRREQGKKMEQAAKQAIQTYFKTPEDSTTGAKAKRRPGSSVSPAAPATCSREGSESSSQGSSYAGDMSLQQQQIEDSIIASWDINHPRAKKLHLSLCRMVIMDKEPFYLLNKRGFRDFIGEFFPKYKIPSHNYFKDKVIPKLYLETKLLVRGMLEEAAFISYDTDIWTSGAHDAYISLIGHAVLSNFDQQYIVLHSRPFPERHTSNNISHIINEMIDHWGIPHSKCHVICHDNASNVTGAVTSEAEIGSIPCFIHTSQLIIKDSLLLQRDVSKMVNKCKNLHTHFSHSSLAHTRLATIQRENNSPLLKPIGAVVTRWDSTINMLQRIKEIKNSLMQFVTMGHGPEGFSFTGDDWRLLDMVIDLYQCMKDNTKIFSKRYTSAAEIIPEIQVLKYIVRTAANAENIVGIQATVHAMTEAMADRYQHYLRNRNCILATFLDPRYRETTFYPNALYADRIEEHEVPFIEECLKESYRQYYVRKQQEQTAGQNHNEKESDNANNEEGSAERPEQQQPQVLEENASQVQVTETTSRVREENMETSQTTQSSLDLDEGESLHHDTHTSTETPYEDSDTEMFQNSQEEDLIIPDGVGSPSTSEGPSTRSKTIFDRQDYAEMFVDTQDINDIDFDTRFPGFFNGQRMSVSHSHQRHSDIKEMLFRPRNPQPALAENAGSSSEIARHLASLANDLIRYRSLPLLDMTENPFLWWKEHRVAMPYLAVLAAKYLSGPATSVDSERLFSDGGQIISNLRNRVTPENAETLMFLSANLNVMPRFPVSL